MSLLGQIEHLIPEKKPKLVRRQHCIRCKNVLAVQICEKIDHQSEAEYYVVDGCLWIKGEPCLSYKQEKWFGNWVRCPVCGLEGRLPIDAPLSWELMQSRVKEFNAIQN